MLVVRPDTIEDCVVTDLAGLLRPGDVLVFNDARVIPAQLEGRRGEAKVGATLHKREGPREWRAFIRHAKRVRDKDRIDIGEGAAAIAAERAAAGSMRPVFGGATRPALPLTTAARMPTPTSLPVQRAAAPRNAP